MERRIKTEVEQALLSEYQKYYRLAYSYVKNEQDALDIVQESAYKAIRDCRGIRNREYISTWIYRIVMNTAIDFLRARKKESYDLKENDAVHLDFYDEGDVMEMLDCLDEKDRTIIILRFFEELQISEIAAVLGENVNTIKARLYRALKKLKVNLEPETVV